MLVTPGGGGGGKSEYSVITAPLKVISVTIRMMNLKLFSQKFVGNLKD